MVTPNKPSAPGVGQRARGKVFSRSMASALGATWFNAKPRTVSRSISAVSPSEKSKAVSPAAMCRFEGLEAILIAGLPFLYELPGYPFYMMSLSEELNARPQRKKEPGRE